MTLYEKVKIAIKQSKTGGLEKIVKFEHSGCVYGVQYTGDHRGDRVRVWRCFLGGSDRICLIHTRDFKFAVHEIMIDSQYNHYNRINQFNRLRSYRKLNHCFKSRVQWDGDKAYMIRNGIEYAHIKRLPWETKYDIFNGKINL